MQGIVGGLLSGQEQISATTILESTIKQNVGVVKGTVSVARPIKTEISIGVSLGNKPDKPGQLKLRQLKIGANNLKGKAALGALGIKAKAESVLQNPNKALADALKTQLEPRGVNLKGLGVAFINGDKLFIKLVGEAA